MDKKFLIWENPRQAIWTLMLVLMVIGCINVFSASYIMAEQDIKNTFFFLSRYAAYAGLGFLLIHAIRKCGYKIFLSKRFVNIIYFVVLLMLGLVEFMGLSSGGAQRWLPLGPVTVQPSELAKLVVIMMCARYLGELIQKKRFISLFSGDGLILTMGTLVYGGLVHLQPDMGTATIIVALLLCLFFIAGIPAWEVFAVVITAVAGAVLMVITKPYRWERIKVWFDPWLDASDTGYQMVQSLYAIGSGGLTGTNWGQGTSKFFYLPEAHTDFAFAVFCQENGLLGATLLILLFLILGLALFKIAVLAKSERGFLLAAGVSFLIVGQAAANMAMVCGVLPVIGVPLVFISYGGTSMVISMIAIGLALAVYDDEVKRAQEEEVRKPQERRNDLRVVSRRWQP